MDNNTYETKGISYPTWLLEVIDCTADRFGNTRAHYATKGSMKQIIFEMTIGRVMALLERAFGIEIDQNETEEVTVVLPKELMRMCHEHCLENGYDFNSMCRVGLTKFMICKDAPRSVWNELIKECRSNDPTLLYKCVE